MNGLGGTYKITINDDGTGTIAISYHCSLNFFEEGYDNQEDCEANEGEWNGGDSDITWVVTDSGYTLISDDPDQPGISETPFTISGTTLTATAINESNCNVMIFEAE